MKCETHSDCRTLNSGHICKSDHDETQENDGDEGDNPEEEEGHNTAEEDTDHDHKRYYI